jgi:hypothetical protein
MQPWTDLLGWDGRGYNNRDESQSTVGGRRQKSETKPKQLGVVLGGLGGSRTAYKICTIFTINGRRQNGAQSGRIRFAQGAFYEVPRGEVQWVHVLIIALIW